MAARRVTRYAQREYQRGDFGPRPPQGGEPQMWQPRHHHHHFHPEGPGEESGIVQHQPPGGDGRPGPRPPWENSAPGADRHTQDQWAMGPRMNAYRGWAPQGSWEDRRDARGPAPQEWHREFQAPQRDWSRGQFEAPRNGGQFDGRQFGPGPRGFGRDEWGPRSQGVEPRRGPGPSFQRPPGNEQGAPRPPMPPRPPGPDGERFQRGSQQAPPPEGAEGDGQSAPAAV